MTTDLVNGLLETGGALVTLLSVRRLLHDRCLRGAHWGPTIFFEGWGIWNLVFYPSLGLPLSTAGAALLVLVNGLYLSLMLRFRTRRTGSDYTISWGKSSFRPRTSPDVIVQHTGPIPEDIREAMSESAETLRSRVQRMIDSGELRMRR